jgi:ABC-type lipoprotein release transport system permease subunit
LVHVNQVIADDEAGGVTVCTMMGTFAGLALGMAVVGVFGVVAYTVAQRTNEIGIRMAIGAKKSDVLRMVVRKGVVLGTVGGGIGLALAAPLMWWLRPESAQEDLLPLNLRISVLVAAAFLIGLAALLASYIPARRATKVDPIVALRHE